jgi:hypothetical protein
VVLSLVSPVLRKMIAWEQHRQYRAVFSSWTSDQEQGAQSGAPEDANCDLPILRISLPEVEIEVLQRFMQFVYTGKITCCAGVKDLVKLGRLADILDVRSLQEMVESAARQMLSVHTCGSLLQFSIDCCLSSLRKHCTRFALENFVAVSQTETFPRLHYEVVEALLGDDRLACAREEAVYEGLSFWLRENFRTDAVVVDQQHHHHRNDCEAHDEASHRDADNQGHTAADHDAAERKSQALELSQTERTRLKQLISTVRFALIPDTYLRDVVQADAHRLDCAELSDAAHAALAMPSAERLAVERRGGCGPELEQWMGMKMATELKGHAGPIDTLAVYGQSRIISGSRDGSIRVWNTETGACEGVLSIPGEVACGSVYKLLVHNDVLFSGSQCKGRGPLHAWSLSNMQYLSAMEGHKDAVMSMAARGGFLWTGSWDATVREWDVPTLECTRVLISGMSGPVLSLSLCGDAIVCNSVTEGAEVWNIADARHLKMLLPADKKVRVFSSLLVACVCVCVCVCVYLNKMLLPAGKKERVLSFLFARFVACVYVCTSNKVLLPVAKRLLPFCVCVRGVLHTHTHLHRTQTLSKCSPVNACTCARLPDQTCTWQVSALAVGSGPSASTGSLPVFR